VSGLMPNRSAAARAVSRSSFATTATIHVRRVHLADRLSRSRDGPATLRDMTNPPEPLVPIVHGATNAQQSDPALPPAPVKPTRPGWVLPVIVGLVVLLLAVGGVAAWAITRGGTGPFAGAPATYAPPRDGGRYDTPQALIAELERRGVACTGYDETEGAIGAVFRGSCYIGGQEAVVSIYATSADAQAHPRILAGLSEGIDDVDMVVGLNWTVNCDTPAMAAQLSGVLGGQVVHDPM